MTLRGRAGRLSRARSLCYHRHQTWIVADTDLAVKGDYSYGGYSQCDFDIDAGRPGSAGTTAAAIRTRLQALQMSARERETFLTTPF